jgi:hypothetical protein
VYLNAIQPFPLTKEIFSFPSLYMWIPLNLWGPLPPSYNRFKYENNYNKHRDTLAIQKELSIKIPYEILSKYLDSINLSGQQTNIEEYHANREEYEVVINGIITLIEIRLGIIKNIIEKNQLIEKDNSTRELVLNLKKKEEYMISEKKQRESELQPTISMEALQRVFRKLDVERAEEMESREKERRNYLEAYSPASMNEELRFYIDKFVTYDEFVQKKSDETGNIIDPIAPSILVEWSKLPRST